MNMIKWNEVTWHSRLGAIILFIAVIPTLSFYIGTQYEVTIESQDPNSLAPLPSTGDNHVNQQMQMSVSTSTPPSEATPTTALISSSTVQVGEFTIVVTCRNKNPFDIQVLKDGAVYQTFGIQADDTGVYECPQAEVRDINFDGYPDFMVLSDTGTGGGSFEFWLFSSTTGQFGDNSYLINPRFDPKTKTVTSYDSLGAGTTEVTTYDVVDGKLHQVSDDTTNQ